VKYYTAHVRPTGEPVLVREGFSWGALLLGPLWLIGHRSWISAALSLAAFILIWVLTSSEIAWVLSCALALLLGLSGHDLRRWSMEHGGYLLIQVLAARSEPAALARLLASRPDLSARFMPPEAAR